MKIAGLPKHREWTKNFDTGFKDLEELPAYISLDDAPESGIFQEVLPAIQCESASFGGFPSFICLNRWHPELGKIGRAERPRHRGKRWNVDIWEAQAGSSTLQQQYDNGNLQANQDQ